MSITTTRPINGPNGASWKCTRRPARLSSSRSASVSRKFSFRSTSRTVGRRRNRSRNCSKNMTAPNCWLTVCRRSGWPT
ncbi:Uncharacterised protein [Bordetella pertussis]|nr:Uncharacterised protein [Bordetella pertussis]